MMNKKLIALFVAISTVNATFCLLDDIFEGTGKVVTGTVDTATAAPRRIVTGETAEDRRLRLQAEEEATRDRESLINRRYPSDRYDQRYYNDVMD